MGEGPLDETPRAQRCQLGRLHHYRVSRRERGAIFRPAGERVVDGHRSRHHSERLLEVKLIDVRLFGGMECSTSCGPVA